MPARSPCRIQEKRPYAAVVGSGMVVSPYTHSLAVRSNARKRDDPLRRIDRLAGDAQTRDCVQYRLRQHIGMFGFPSSDGRHSAHRRGEAKALLANSARGQVSARVSGWFASSAKEVRPGTQKPPYGGSIHGRNRFRDLFTKFPGFNGLLDMDALCREPVDQVLVTAALEFRIVVLRGNPDLQRQLGGYEFPPDRALEPSRCSSADIEIGVLGPLGKTVEATPWQNLRVAILLNSGKHAGFKSVDVMCQRSNAPWSHHRILCKSRWLPDSRWRRVLSRHSASSSVGFSMSPPCGAMAMK